MAKVEITPLNISGVKLPFNLLDNLLGQKIDYSNLVYPMDLATNPQYCHAIQFSVHEYKYPKVEEAYQNLSASFDRLGAAAQAKYNDAASASIPNTSLAGVGSAIVAKGSALANQAGKVTMKGVTDEVKNSWNNLTNANLSAGVQGAQQIMQNAPAEVKEFFSKVAGYSTSDFKLQPIDKPLAYISLYMPDTLTTNFTSSYDPVSLTNTFGIAGYGVNAVADAMKDKKALDENVSNLLSDDYRRGALAGILGKIDKDLGSVVGQALQRVPNPQLQMIYRGINLREFTFDFTFTPASSKEAEEVDQIIKTFVYYSLPEVTSGAGGQFFIPPQIFRIKFAFLGDAGPAGQIYDIFKTNMTNLLGNQFTKIITGSNATNDITKAKNAKIFNIGDCVLKDVQVNYAPNGWASYNDGYPIQTTLSLNFSEIDLVNKQTMEKNGYAPKSLAKEIHDLGLLL